MAVLDTAKKSQLWFVTSFSVRAQVLTIWAFLWFNVYMKADNLVFIGTVMVYK